MKNFHDLGRYVSLERRAHQAVLSDVYSDAASEAVNNYRLVEAPTSMPSKVMEFERQTIVGIDQIRLLV